MRRCTMARRRAGGAFIGQVALLALAACARGEPTDPWAQSGTDWTEAGVGATGGMGASGATGSSGTMTATPDTSGAMNGNLSGGASGSSTSDDFSASGGATSGSPTGTGSAAAGSMSGAGNSPSSGTAVSGSASGGAASGTGDSGSGSDASDAASCTPITRGLLGHWTMDAASISGTTLADSSGSRNNGTLVGFSQPETAAGRFGGALVYPSTGAAY